MELCLCIVPVLRDRGPYFYNRPLGAVLVGKTDRQIKAKWIEILGYMVDSSTRGKIGPQFPYTATSESLWIQAYRDVWETLKDTIERGKPSPAEWDAAVDTAWTNLLRDGRVEGAMPLDPRGDVDVITTWVWSNHERSIFLPIKLDEPLMSRGDTEEILAREPYIDPDDDREVHGPNWMIDWENDLGMSEQTLQEVRDPAFVFHPRLNIRVNPAIKQRIIRRG